MRADYLAEDTNEMYEYIKYLKDISKNICIDCWLILTKQSATNEHRYQQHIIITPKKLKNVKDFVKYSYERRNYLNGNGLNYYKKFNNELDRHNKDSIEK